MGWFRTKKDPTTAYARAVNDELASVQERIRKLTEELDKPRPRLRSTAVPDQTSQPRPAPPPPKPEPVFEPVDRNRLEGESEALSPEHYNELGVRKYDLLSVWRRLRDYFRPPPTTNPKLVQYLAAGSIQGLRPLRYEKRVARNRLIALAVVLLLVLWGLYAFWLRR